ncbi:MAG: phosphatase PAP2 family protein [Ornithinimicrobium sp.]
MMKLLAPTKSEAYKMADRYEVSDEVALWWWASGNVVEVALLGGLFVDAVRTRSAASVVRAATPLAVERAMVFTSNQLVNRDRPNWWWQRPGKLSPSSTSFPSGHASNAFLSASLLTHRTSAPFLFGLAGLVAATRLIVRVHHPSDIAAGAVAGVAIGRALNRWAPVDDQ